ncbi:hypothetical protein SNEBB_008315 [Seison nebaliae]|nr:hypothetical protein SNEBB_008315 [Seison nebaliae]
MNNDNIQQNVIDAFNVFADENTNTVNIRELGSILRSLLLVPSESDISELVGQLVDDEHPEIITMDKFIPVAKELIETNRFPPAKLEELKSAFNSLHRVEKEFFTKDEFKRFMTSEREPLTEEEMAEMWTAALDPKDDVIKVKDYMNKLYIELNTQQN